ncbi:plant basic secretory protein [Pleurotus eryngii]|uniref:Plant basic secretory protein n=1 Tax=Pleurotus eryngii TaxID=5323 RepID=A0A9P6DCX9_PLEER|nr:plant basic secretory protein [Pleurotus eryngii]
MNCVAFGIATFHITVMPPTPPPDWPVPTFTLRVEDVAHPGAIIFFQCIQPVVDLRGAVLNSFKWLYTPENVPTNVKSILLVLCSMPGVAHTFGSSTHKEIHFSLEHINNCASRAREEILGVLTHEVVHCYQYNAKGQCPGGLIEGVADWVRLQAGLGPPHWKRSPGDKWDAGYEATAYFLEWIEGRYGHGTIQELNESMKDVEYDERMFKATTGRRVAKLWRLYRADYE